MRPFNVVHSFLWRLGLAHTLAGSLLVHRSNFGHMPFLTPSECRSEWVGFKRPHQHIIDHFGDESSQLITCTGTDNLTRTNKSRNTQITQRKTVALNSTTDTLKKRKLRDRRGSAWFSRLSQHPATKWRGPGFFQPWNLHGVQSARENWSQVHWVKVQHLDQSAAGAP